MQNIPYDDRSFESAMPTERTSEPHRPPIPVLVDRKEVARLLTLKERTIDELRRNEGLPSVRFGKLIRYDLHQVKKWLDERPRRMFKRWKSKGRSR
jgi:excisionase family DNA binding protein